ncbi:hypothetical protein AB4Z01_11010 [Inquilinus sp. YAF38]|uniref:hypothetical protein n=1 Tax=Inquilinus sp. YAF38 TaxID=3233084 RepID=UPI003F931EAE
MIGSLRDRILSDTVLLATITGAGYLFAYGFNFGFAKHFGYPSELYYISVSDVLLSIAAVIALLAPGFQGYVLFTSSFPDTEFYRYLSVFLVLIIIVTAAILRPLIPSYGTVIAPIVVFLAFVLLQVAYLFFLKTGKIRNYMFNYSVSRSFQSFLIALIISIFILYIVGSVVGQSEAKSRTLYKFSYGDKEYIALRIANERIICARLLNGNTISKSFIIYEEKTVEGLEFVPIKQSDFVWSK